MKVSIGIPFYNAEEYFYHAIESVVKQSYQDWELILVDDGSTDSSLKIAENFSKKDNRIRVISDGLNKKLPYRLNQIIDESKGEYIARMDADDLIHPDRIKIQLEFLEKNNNFDLVSTGVVSINDKNQIRGIRCLENIYTDFSIVKRNYPIVHASVLARKSWYNRNQYDISLPRSEDFELWCRTISNNDLKIAVLPQALYYYREEGLVTYEKLLKSYEDGLQVYKKYSDNPSVKVIMGAKFRIILTKFLNKFDLIQKMATLRNRKKIDPNLISYHESVINKIMAK
ncbi:glycosyltransferase family 2 protein [Acinetobacter radioresistens]|jgi:glycosyltransferase involved in cell wall biosynthesis|uniref:glycosyltransferase family 2 protein n=1 Tax=Acinetobacter radioresistens TaxID=40216 RepID=UPI00300A521A